MQIGLSTLAFTGEKGEDALAAVRRLGFHSVDMALFEWAHPDWTPAQVAADPQRAAARLLEVAGRLGLTVVAFNAAAGDDETVSGLCEFAAAAGVPILTLPAPAAGTELGVACERLRGWVAAAKARGVTLTVETHVGQLTELPEAALQLVQAVEGLSLTLDPSHFVAGPWQGRDFTGLFPVTAHVHLRDAGESWERVQLAPGTGKIDFGALFQGLRASGYDGALSIEYLRSLAGRDVSDDVRRMRELFLAWQDGGR